MGQYRAKRKIYTLQFEDHEGLEVRAHGVSMGKLFQVADQAEAAREGAGFGETRELVDLFVASLVAWNLADEEGQDTPLTSEGLLSHETDLVLATVLAWFDAMVSISSPLGRRSTAGSTFPVASIPMEIPSPNLKRSPTPN